MTGIYRAGADTTFAVAQRMRLATANLPVEYRELRLTDIDSSVYPQQDSWNEIESFATRTRTETRGRGLLIAGPPGQGKTMIACALLNEARYRRKSWVRFQTLPALMQMRTDLIFLDKQTDSISQWSSAQMYRLLRRMQGTGLGSNEPPFGLLVLDDVGKEYKTESGFASAEFDMIIRHRHNAGLPTIITTNLGFDEWAEGYHLSTKSFIRQAFEATPLDTGRDLRGER